MVENLDSCVHSLEAKENFELVGGYDYILLYVNNLSK
jgi:hypothetical protein